VHESWTGNQLGDLFLGAKVSLMSQERQQPMAFAVRGTAKLPTADEDRGAGTGEWDWFADAIGSGEVGGVELSGFGGFAFRGDPDEVSLSDGLRWGFGAGFPSRGSFRATAEIFGEWLFDEAVEAPSGFVVGTDGSLSPSISRITDDVTTAFGITWQHPSGVLLGAALSYTFGIENDVAQGTPRNDEGDAIGLQFRIGFHRGVGIYVPQLAPPPPPPAAAAVVPPPAPVAEAAVVNRPPTVKARCEPCTLEPGSMATLRAESADPDGDKLTIRWTTTGGTIVDTQSPVTTWRAETAPGLTTFTVTVEDGRGGVASDKITIETSALQFEDVHFAFDSARLDDKAMPILQSVVAALQKRPGMRLQIEGHTCNIGTAEYNVALGERRANAVQQYLRDRGISPERVTIVSYGEEKPKHDNSEENTRALNRRGAFVVRITDPDSQ
jgi:outer membrane protein OmpA-like peptidoglycan-associated protein